MKRHSRLTGVLAALAFLSAGCADRDNPTALADLNIEAEFELAPAQAETFEEAEIHVHLRAGGQHIAVREPHLEIRQAAGRDVRVVEMKPEGDGYAAHVMFYEPGEHHLHMLGTPRHHNLQWELGEHDVHVRRRHHVIGPYWVELAVVPAPVFARSSAHVRAYVFALQADGLPGAVASGLHVEMEFHGPTGNRAAHHATEKGAGEYEVLHAFGPAGTHEIHVSIETGSGHAEGEFHLPVLAPQPPSGDTGSGGHGH